MPGFPLCSIAVVCCKCVFRQPKKLATYNKGKREQTLNICFLLHSVLWLWATYFLLCLKQGRGGMVWEFLGGWYIERCLTLEAPENRVSHGPHVLKSHFWETLCVHTWHMTGRKHTLSVQHFQDICLARNDSAIQMSLFPSDSDSAVIVEGRYNSIL